MKIVVAGNALVDIVKKIDVYPEKNMLCNIKEITLSVGGAVPNTSFDLKALDKTLDVVPFAKIGNDANGTFIDQEMQKKALSTNHLLRDDTPTGFTDVMNDANGERTFFHYRGANAHLSYEDFIHLDFSDVTHFHLGYLLLLDSLDQKDAEFKTKAARLLAYIRDKGIKTSVDVVSENSSRFRDIILPALPYCDYLIINEIEAGRIANISPYDAENHLSSENMDKILRYLIAAGVHERVVVHCPEKGFVINRQGHITRLPSLNLPKDYIKGSVGAGDAFCAGALYAIMHGYSDADLLRLASCSAANNLAVIDAVSGAQSLEQTMALEKQFTRKKE